MNKLTVSILALSALLLAGCGHHRHGHPGKGLGMNPTQPQVSIVDGKIKLDQEILLFLRREKVTVTWSLPASGPYRFAENGIVIEGQIIDKVLREKETSVVLDTRQKEIVDCRRAQDGLQFTCVNNHTAPGVFKYTIRVTNGQQVIERDPPVVNM